MKKIPEIYTKINQSKPNRTQSPDFRSGTKITPTKSPQNIEFILKEKDRQTTPIRNSDLTKSQFRTEPQKYFTNNRTTSKPPSSLNNTFGEANNLKKSCHNCLGHCHCAQANSEEVVIQLKRIITMINGGGVSAFNPQQQNLKKQNQSLKFQNSKLIQLLEKQRAKPQISHYEMENKYLKQQLKNLPEIEREKQELQKSNKVLSSQLKSSEIKNNANEKEIENLKYHLKLKEQLDRKTPLDKLSASKIKDQYNSSLQTIKDSVQDQVSSHWNQQQAGLEQLNDKINLLEERLKNFEVLDRLNQKLNQDNKRLKRLLAFEEEKQSLLSKRSANPNPQLERLIQENRDLNNQVNRLNKEALQSKAFYQNQISELRAKLASMSGNEQKLNKETEARVKKLMQNYEQQIKILKKEAKVNVCNHKGIQQELERLYSQNEELKKQNQALKNENQRHVGDKKKLKEENTSIGVENNKLKWENDSLKLENSSFQEQYNKIKSENEDLQRENELLRAQNEKLKEQKALKQKEGQNIFILSRSKDDKLRQLNEQISRLLNERNQQNDEINRLENQIENLNQQIKQKEQELGNLSNTVSSQQNYINQLKKIIQQKEQALGNAESRLRDAQFKQHDAIKRLAEKQHELGIEKEEKRSIIELLNKLKGQLNVKEERIIQLERQVKDLQNSLNYLNNLVEETEMKVGQMENMLQRKNQQLNKLNDENFEIKLQNEKLKSKNLFQQNQLSNINNKHSYQINYLKQLLQEKEAQEQNFLKIRSKVADLENTGLRKQIEELKIMIRDSNFQKLSQELERLTQNYQAEILKSEEIGFENDRLIKDKLALEDKIGDLERLRLMLQEKIKILQGNNKLLEEELQERKNFCESMMNQKSALQRQNLGLKKVRFDKDALEKTKTKAREISLKIDKLLALEEQRQQSLLHVSHVYSQILLDSRANNI